MKTVAEKYIRGEREIIAVVDRSGGITPYLRSARWIVWSVAHQVTLSEHGTRRAALRAYDERQ